MIDPRLRALWPLPAPLVEPVVFMGEGGAEAEARLLFPAREIVAITDAAGVTVFVEDEDVAVDRAEGRLVRPAPSRAPLVAPDAAAVHNAEQMYARLVMVHYTPEVAPSPPPAAPATAALAQTRARLARGVPLSVCVVGDSISEGYDSSGFLGVAPRQPGYPSRVTAALIAGRGSMVRLHNLAVAGSSAADGRWLARAVLDVEPHLLMVAYGMNDAAWAEADEYAANLAGLVAEVLAVRPDVEVLLVSPMLPAPACSWVRPERFPAYAEALAVLADQVGAALADVTSLWAAVLARKSPYDLTANGTNHPNDFGHWLYARAILDLLRG